MPMKIVYKKSKGFNLIEISVSLAIVAAIISLVVGGAKILENSKTGSAINDIQRYIQGSEKFLREYKALPGDLSNVEAIDGDGINSGNGNNIIDTTDEAIQFWRHLANSGITAAKYDDTDPNSTPIGTKKNSSLRIRLASDISEHNISDNALVMEYTNISGTSGILTPANAKEIDEKVDDGNPSSGNILAIGTTATNCFSANVYNLGNEDEDCSILYVRNTSGASGVVNTVMTGECSEIGSVREISDTSSCPQGYSGKIVQTCRIGSDNVGAWETTSKNCEIITCAGGYDYGDTKRTKCINNLVGKEGIVKKCNEAGVWELVSSDCEMDTTARCSKTGEIRGDNACDINEEGAVAMQCSVSNIWQVRDDQCVAVRCASPIGDLGEVNISAMDCGNANYNGDGVNVCSVEGNWIPTSIGNKCAPIYGSCTDAADKDIGCIAGEEGNHILTCVDNGENDYWTTKINTCKPIQCSGGANIGDTKISKNALCSRGEVGKIIEYCDIDGKWKLTDQNCTNTCPDYAGNNATWPTTIADTENVEALSCEDGYSAVVLPTRNCNADGTWNETVTGTCVKVGCPAGPYLNATFPATAASSTGVNGRCNHPNYEGNATAECNISSNWENESDNCVLVGIPETADLVIWQDAADANTVLSSNECDIENAVLANVDTDNVGCWLDKSGNDNHFTQSTSSDQPSYISNQIGGKNVLYFDGVNDTMTNSTIDESANDYTIFLVEYDSVSSGSSGYFESTGQLLLGNKEVVSNTSKRYFEWEGIASGNNSLSTELDESYKRIWSLTLVNDTIPNHYVNGSFSNNTLTDKYYQTPLNATSSLGSYASGTGHYKGNIGEMIIYRGAKTRSERESVETYLSGKWGISLEGKLEDDHMFMWYDMADAGNLHSTDSCESSNVSANELVGCINDKSPENNDATQSSYGRATYKNNLMNNVAGLEFDGGFDEYQIDLTYLNNSNYYIYMVLARTEDKDENYLLSSNASRSTNQVPYIGFRNNNTFTFAQWDNDIDMSISAYTSPLTLITKTYLDTATGRKGFIWGDGTEKSSSTTNTSTFQNIQAHNTFLARWGIRKRYAGYAGEIIGYNDLLTASDQTEIETYLSDKWGVDIESTLPNDDMFMWYDMADADNLFTSDSCSGSNASFNGTVGCIKDKSPENNNATQSDSSSRATYKDNLMNNVAGLEFDGSNDEYDIDLTYLNNSNYYIYMVLARTDDKNNNYLLSSNRNNSDNEIPHFGFRNNDTFTFAQYGNDIDVSISAYTSPLTIITKTYLDTGTGREGFIWGDGTEKFSNISNNSTFKNIATNDGRIGYRDSGKYFEGYAGEIIGYNDLLTAPDQTEIETYLSDKWGVDTERTLPMFMWYDMADADNLFTSDSCSGGTASFNTTVGCIKDKSPENNNATQSNSSSRATYKDNLMNNVAGLEFDGSNKYDMDLTYLNNSNYYIYMVLARTDNKQHNCLLGSNRDNSTNEIPHFCFRYNSQFRFSQWGNDFNISVSTYTSPLTLIIKTYLNTETGREGFIWGDGTERSSSTSNKSTFKNIATNDGRIGFRHPGLYFEGYAGEVIGYNDLLTFSEQTEIETYLSDKWGVTVNP